MQRKPKVVAAAMVVAAMVVATACGGGDDADPSDAMATSLGNPASTTDAPATTTAASLAPTTVTSTTVTSTTVSAPAITVTATPSGAPAATTPSGPPATASPPPTAPRPTAPPPTAPPPTAPSTTPPPSTGRFTTRPVGAGLPSDGTCAAAVRRTPEVRTSNAAPNSTRGVGADSLYPRVTGDFTGTTDEILQWVACKWGIDEDIVRAQIAKESWWHMSTVGDNGESFGLGQVRVPYHGTAFVNNNARASSAYNVDYTYAVWRECFEGRLGWLNDVEHTGTYAAGDVNGCLGVWFAGRWRTPAAITYIADVQSYLNQRVWETTNFKNG